MKRIGYWRKKEDSKEDLPWPKEGRISGETKGKVVDFLLKGKQSQYWMGYSYCRLCGKMNGTTCWTRGQFTYPEGYVHYIRDHNIMPDLDLLTEVLL